MKNARNGALQESWRRLVQKTDQRRDVSQGKLNKPYLVKKLQKEPENPI